MSLSTATATLDVVKAWVSNHWPVEGSQQRVVSYWVLGALGLAIAWHLVPSGPSARRRRKSKAKDKKWRGRKKSGLKSRNSTSHEDLEVNASGDSPTNVSLRPKTAGPKRGTFPLASSNTEDDENSGDRKLEDDDVLSVADSLDTSDAPDKEDGEIEDDEDSQNHDMLPLLYAIASESAARDAVIHRSITCNHCGTSPIRGIRFKCGNCNDFDICERCENNGTSHPKTHVFLKIRIPIPPLTNPRSCLLPLLYPDTYPESGKNITHRAIDFPVLEQSTKFDTVELKAFFEQFKSLSTVEPDGGITFPTFQKCLGPLGLEKNLITERIFAFFDQDNDSVILFPEFVRGLSILCKGSLDERIRCTFEGYDLNGDGLVSREELSTMFRAYFNLSMELVRDVVKTMEDGILENFDDEGTKPVSASFTAPIPSTLSSTSDDERTEKSGKNDKRAAGSNLVTTFERSTSKSPQKRPLRPSPLRTLPLSDSPLLSPAIMDSPIFSAALNRSSSGTSGDSWPNIETISQEAIAEMVNRTFTLAGASDSLTFPQFVSVVEQDSNLLAWFEALGSVF